MADILIRGMEMPDSCSNCPMCYDMIECTVSPLQFWYGRPENEQFDFCHERHPDCPLVELPPHGDLVDRDEIIEQIAETPFTMSMFQTVEECRAAINAKEVILNVVAYADAVIPSNKERSEDA